MCIVQGVWMKCDLEYRRVDCTAWRGAVLEADDRWRRVLWAISSRLTCNDSACGAVGVASGPQHDNRRIVVRFATRGKRFMSSVNAQTVSRIHPASYLLGTGAVTLGGYIGRRGKLTCHFCLVPRLTVSEWSYTSTPLYVFIACTVSLLQPL